MYRRWLFAGEQHVFVPLACGRQLRLVGLAYMHVRAD